MIVRPNVVLLYYKLSFGTKRFDSQDDEHVDSCSMAYILHYSTRILANSFKSARYSNRASAEQGE